MKFDCPRCYGVERLVPCKLRPFEHLLLLIGLFPVQCEACQFRTLRSFIVRAAVSFFSALSNFDEVVDSVGEFLFWQIGRALHFAGWLLFGLPCILPQMLFARLFGERPAGDEMYDSHHVVDESTSQVESVEMPQEAKKSQVTWPSKKAVRKVLEGKTVSHSELNRLLAHHIEPQRKSDQDHVQN